MAIVIRHNGALNNAAEGLASGVSQGIAFRQRQQALDDDKALAERRLRLAETVQASEMEIRAADEKRRAEAFDIQKQNMAGQKEAAGAISEYATSGGRDPGFQPNYVETADPIEQQLHANAAHAARIGKLVAAKDPSLLPMFLEETHKAQHSAMLKGLAARELSAWQSMGTNPTMGPLMAGGEGGNQSQLAARAKQATDALQAAMGDGQQEPDPQALQQAIGLSAAARNESMMQQAKLQDQTAESQNLTAVYGNELNTMEAALTRPPPGLERLTEIWPMIREQAQLAVSRARQALAAYNVRLGGPNPMTASELHNTFDKAMKDAGDAFKARGTGGSAGISDDVRLRAQFLAEWKANHPDTKNDLGHVTKPGEGPPPGWIDLQVKGYKEGNGLASKTDSLPDIEAGFQSRGGVEQHPTAAPAMQPEQVAAQPSEPVKFTAIPAPDRARFIAELRAAVLRGDREKAQALMQGVDMDSIPKAIQDKILGATNEEKKKGRDKEAAREVDSMYGNSDMPR